MINSPHGSGPTTGMGHPFPQNIPVASGNPQAYYNQNKQSHSKYIVIFATISLFAVIATAGGMYIYFNSRNSANNVSKANNNQIDQDDNSQVGKADNNQEKSSSDSQKSNPPSSSSSSTPSASVPQLPPIPTAQIKEQELSGEEIYRQLTRSCVLIEDRTGRGSGFVIDMKHRLIITNDHVITDNLGKPSELVVVYFPIYNQEGKPINDFKVYKGRKENRVLGRVVMREPRADLAIVQLVSLPAHLDVQPVPFAPAPATPGNTVYSIGNSSVGEGALWRLSTGTVRLRAQQEWRYEDGIQRKAWILETQAPTNWGDSGGPTVNNKGELVGIVAGGDPSQQLVSFDIDLEEVLSLTKRYFATIRET